MTLLTGHDFLFFKLDHGIPWPLTCFFGSSGCSFTSKVSQLVFM